MEELTEWAQREKLGTKFVSAIPEVVQNGGLRKVTDKFLFEDLKIRLTPMRRNILEAIRRKLAGNKQVRFGEVEKLEPILHKRPKFTKCPWVDLAEIEEGHDKETLQAAMTTWRFCATGVDGLEETSLMREVFAPETLPPSHPRLWRRSAVLSWLPSGSPCRGAPLSHQYPPKDT